MLKSIALTFLAFCALSAFSQQPVEVEIKDYKGLRLGSVEDFGENSIKGVQKVDIASYRLSVSGMVEKKLSLGYQEALALRHQKKVITLQCVEGWGVKALWEGIPLAELFKLAGVKDGATTVIFRSVDGYSTSLSLKTIMDRDIILADRINSIVLPPAQGFPFILAAEDKWGYKWARWVASIELTDDDSFKGFWESRGYDNSGDLLGTGPESGK